MEIISASKDHSDLLKKIGYQFHNESLFIQAMTHSSYANEKKTGHIQDYERLEFLGDAVLEMVSSDRIFHANPGMPEGQMTRLRASLVCEPALAVCARDIGLEEYIRLGKGEERSGGRNRDSIISDVMEALIGAMYLDGGIEPAREFINRFILDELKDSPQFKDSKTELQEMIQAMPSGSFEYRMTGEEGPDHDKVFNCEAVYNGKVIGKGKGHSKKAAQQNAAAQAIDCLKNNR